MTSIETLDQISINEGTDKSSVYHNYTRYYEKHFSIFRNKSINLLELGVKDGASLRVWKKYFNKGNIVGIDLLEECSKFKEERIDVFIGKQQDPNLLLKVGKKYKDGFDIIIDDASHHNKFTIASFKNLFNFLRPGGIYAIEDLHCSYEDFGLFDNEREPMSKFITNLIADLDLNGRREIYRYCNSAQDFNKLPDEAKAQLNYYERWIESITFYQGLMFISKKEF